MKTRRHVLLYEPRFAALVASGAKLTTIRARRLSTPVPGDTLDHRAWQGVPYRPGSQQQPIRKSVCSSVGRITINANFGAVQLSGNVWLQDAAIERLARGDGFASADELFHYFTTPDGGPFHGLLIGWLS